MHRVNWDVRYDAPPAFSHSFEINANPGLTPATPEGPLALPGIYIVRLTAGGTTMTQAVTVRNDPRSTATPAALAAQHALQMQITTAMRAAWDAQRQVTELRGALPNAASGNAGADVVAAIAALRAAIDSAVGGEAARVSFRGVNGMMASLLTAQDNADFAPTPSMRAAFSATCRELSTVHAAWQRVLQRDVPRANAVLARHNASPLPVRRAEAPPRC